jgi:hypothetical protein
MFNKLQGLALDTARKLMYAFLELIIENKEFTEILGVI